MNATRQLAAALAAFILLFGPAAGLAQEQVPEEEYAAQAPLAPEALLLDGFIIDDLVVAVGERGHILLSSDGGRSWSQARVPTRATLTGVYFSDRQHGWAVGHDEVILRTEDGGLNWERVYYAPENMWPLLDVWFRDAEHGIAVGAYSSYLVTEDGGRTWNIRDFEPQTAVAPESEKEDDEAWYEEEVTGYDVHLNAIVPAGDGRLYLAGEAGQIFRSDDGGTTWLTLPSPYEGSFYGALPLGGDSLLVFGLRGNLFRSDDAGSTWTALESGTDAMLTDAIRLDDGTIVIVGLAGTVGASRDGGRSFRVFRQPDRKGFESVLPVDGTLLLLGEAGARRIPLPGAASTEDAQ